MLRFCGSCARQLLDTECKLGSRDAFVRSLVPGHARFNSGTSKLASGLDLGKPLDGTQSRRENQRRSSEQHIKALSAKPLRPRSFDRLALANRVTTFLRQGKFAEAYILCVDGIKHGDSAPAWNVLLSDILANKSFSHARKYYLDMRKRGGKPDNYTMNIMITGCALKDESQTHMPKSYKEFIFRFFHNPPEGTAPNNFHLNAAMKALYFWNEVQDLIRLFTDQDLQVRRDAASYTIVFRALAKEGNKDAVEDARIFLGEMINQIRKAKLELDDKVILAYIRILRCSSAGNILRDVISILEHVYHIQCTRDETSGRLRMQYTGNAGLRLTPEISESLIGVCFKHRQTDLAKSLKSHVRDSSLR